MPRCRQSPVGVLLAVSLVVVLLAGGALPASSAAAPQSASITLDVNSGTASSQVVIQGSGFCDWCGIEIYWDNFTQRIGSATVYDDGKFTLTAMIPPSATPGAHNLIAFCDCASPGDLAQATFTVTGRPLKAAYVYNTDLNKAGDFEVNLLEKEAMIDTELVKLSDVTSTNMANYDMIVIGPDTGADAAAWGTTTAAALRIRNSGKPILGLGRGGAALFGLYQLYIGSLDAKYETTQEFTAVDGSAPIYHGPPWSGFSIPPSPIQLYSTKHETAEVRIHPMRDAVFPFGRAMGDWNRYPLAQQSGRFFLWGWSGGPNDMTSDGRRLFVNIVWYLLQVRTDVDTLILADYGRMKDLGYSSASVDALESKVNDLVALPAFASHMTAVVKRLDLDTMEPVRAARATWDADENSVSNTNSYVKLIDGYIEDLKRGIYPNLKYLILVGAHEVVPMQARDDVGSGSLHSEKAWAARLPKTSGYLYSLYRAGGGNNLGHFLSDVYYADLSWVDNKQGGDNGLVPELAVGRLVETPGQITGLLNNYVASDGTLSNNRRAAIGSWDFKDGAEAAAKSMGANTYKLIHDDFNSSLVVTTINANDGFVYLGGHGNYSSFATYRNLYGFFAGHTTANGDTEELDPMPNSVVVSAGCHTGVSLGNKLYHDYDNTIRYGDFPERLANKGVGVYWASTGYTIISATKSSSKAIDAGYSEFLATQYVDKLANGGFSVTAGSAHKEAVNQYLRSYRTLDGDHRKVLGIATLYGMPTYSWQRLQFGPRWQPIGYWWSTQLREWPLARGAQAGPTSQDQVTVEVREWSVDDDGQVIIPGASYTGNSDEPILPVLHASRTLPSGSNLIRITWNDAASESTTLANDLPLAAMSIHTETLANDFDHDGFYPATPYFTSTVSALGGGAVEVGLTVQPVQYDPSTGQTRVWTRLVLDLEYDVDELALAVDSDGDGLPDYWEQGTGLDFNDAAGDQGKDGDPDDDGLANSAELEQGTKPLQADTDGDGVADGREVAQRTDPLNPGSRLATVFLPMAVRRSP